MPIQAVYHRAASSPRSIMALPVIMILICLGCASMNRFDPDVLNEYESQKRIVRQGFIRVPVPEGEWASVFFGYDRNRDYNAQASRGKGRGIDLVEYKRLRPDGHWEFPPFLILVDADFDGFVDWVCLDHDRDQQLDDVYAPDSVAIHFDRIDFNQFKPFAGQPAEQ
ncbi:MAG: hypothetical protein QNJ04_03480 [Desulfobacterales bacterium]|nr:hypothetical protein [Desulfobacterales bacterium]